MQLNTSYSKVIPALFVSLVLGACGGDSTGPGGGGGSAPFTAVIDGTSWAATEGAAVITTNPATPGLYIISGTQINPGDVRALTLTLSNIPGPGTYPLGTGANISGGNGIYAHSTGGWGTPLSGKAGTITISTLTSSRMVASFSFQAEGVSGGATGTVNVVAGNLDLPITTAVSPDPVPEVSMNRIGATLGSGQFRASTVALQSNPALLWGFVASDLDYVVTLNTVGPVTVGSYVTGDGSVARIAVTCTSTTVTCIWDSNSGGTGIITITAIAGGRITGNFIANIPRISGTGDDFLSITDGTFDLGMPPT